MISQIQDTIEYQTLLCQDRQEAIDRKNRALKEEEERREQELRQRDHQEKLLEAEKEAAELLQQLQAEREALENEEKARSDMENSENPPAALPIGTISENEEYTEDVTTPPFSRKLLESSRSDLSALRPAQLQLSPDGAPGSPENTCKVLMSALSVFVPCRASFRPILNLT